MGQDGHDDGQQRALQAAAQLWEEVRAGRGPRLLLLVGPPGVGKTWVVQRLYERLAAAQPTPGYWPDALVERSATTLQARGRVAPERFESPPRSTPAFGWVGINCRLDDGVPVRALEAALAVAEEQHGPIVDPPGLWTRLRLGLWRSVLGAVLVVAGIVVSVLDALGAGGLLLSVLGVAFVAADLGQLRGLAAEIGAWWAARRRHRGHATVDDAGLRRRAQDRAEALRRALRREGLPSVWVVDDAAWADAATVDALRSLLTGDEDALVVATTRPDPFESQLRTREGVGQVVAQVADRTTRHDLGRLPDATLQELVRARAPHTDPAVVRRLVDWSGGNPLVLAGLLEMDVMAARRRNEAYVWDLGELERLLAELPPTVDDVFGVYWHQLPTSVRRLLACAVLQGEQVEPGALCATGRAVLPDDPADELDRARDPHSWLRPVTEHLDRFSDPALLGIAERRAGEVLAPAEREAARRRLLDHVDELRADGDGWLQLPLAVRAILLRAHVAAARERLVAPDAGAAERTLELALLEDRPDDARLSAHHAELAAEWAADDADLHVRACLLAADRHLEAGRGDLAQPWADRALDAAGEDADARPRLRAQRLRGLALGMQGREAEAVAVLDRCAAAAREALGPDDPDTLEDERHLAHWLGRSGRAGEALARFPELVARHRRRLGPAHVDTLIARSVHVFLVGETGRTEDAVRLYRSLVADRAAALGEQHPDTLWSRNNLATMLGRSGRVAEAIELFEQVVVERDRVLGADHPHALKSRENLAHWLGVAGRHAEALRLLEQLADETRLVMGTEHPKTARAEAALREWRRAAAGEARGG